MSKYNFALFLIALSLVFPSSAAEVETITYCDVLPAKSTNWDDNHTLPLFDPSLGELISVDLTANLDLIQNFRFENMGPATQMFGSNSSVELLITTPDSDNISVTANASMTEVLPGFDGDKDFSGPSGRTIEGLTVSNTTVQEYTDPSDFIATVPGETVCLAASARVEGESRVPGNSAFMDTAFAGSEVCVTYAYEPIAPGEGGRSE